MGVLLVLPLQAETHQFTDISGRTLIAEIMEASETSVKVKLKNGKTPTIQLSKLSKDDHLYIEDWKSAHEEDLQRLHDEKAAKRRSIEIPLKIVAFCDKNLGKKVGNGECWTLANEAFKACGLSRPGSDARVWGRLIDPKTEKLEAGDIIEYRSASFSNGTSTGPAHTAIVVKGGRRGRATIAEQNWAGNKTVRKTSFDARSLQKGKIMIYRPDYVTLP